MVVMKVIEELLGGVTAAGLTRQVGRMVTTCVDVTAQVRLTSLPDPATVTDDVAFPPGFTAIG